MHCLKILSLSNLLQIGMFIFHIKALDCSSWIVGDGFMVSNSHVQMDFVLDFMKDVLITKANMNPELYVRIHIHQDRSHCIIYIDRKLCIYTLLQESKFHVVLTPSEHGAQLHSASNATNETFKIVFPYALLTGSI